MTTCRAQQSSGCRSGRAPPPRRARGRRACTAAATSRSSEQTSQPGRARQGEQCEGDMRHLHPHRSFSDWFSFLAKARLFLLHHHLQWIVFTVTATIIIINLDATMIIATNFVQKTWGSRSCLASMSSCQMRRKFSRAQETNCTFFKI